MSKKNVLNMMMLFVVGGVIGGLAAVGFTVLDRDTLVIGLEKFTMFMQDYSGVFYGVLVVMFLLPALASLSKGKKAYKQIEVLSENDDTEDQCDQLQKEADKHLNLGFALNSVFMFGLMMLYGASYTREWPTVAVNSGVFLVLIVVSSSIEIHGVNYIQKNDPRLKGDPTKLSFHKMYLASMDEAERAKVHKAGYNSFLFSRNAGIVLIVITSLLNIFFQTGGFPVVITCGMVIIMQASYAYNEIIGK